MSGGPTRRAPSASRGHVARCLLLVLLSACREQADPDVQDADAGPVGEIRVQELGLGYRLPPAWAQEPKPPAEAEGPRTVLRAIRKAEGREPAFRVAPRLELTAEPTESPSAEAAFSRVYLELKGLGDREDVTVERASYSARPLLDVELAEIRLRYRVTAKEGPGLRVVHRSLLVFRAAAQKEKLVTLTATYLDEDADRIEPEVDRLFESIEVFRPASKGEDSP